MVGDAKRGAEVSAPEGKQESETKHLSTECQRWDGTGQDRMAAMLEGCVHERTSVARLTDGRKASASASAVQDGDGSGVLRVEDQQN
jgi:hypothetical protein